MKGFIYEIKCNETNEIYIGSTIQTIKARMNQHRQIKRCASKQIIERNNYVVNILEEVEFIDINDLRIKEQYYIDTTTCINKMKAFYTVEDKELNKIKNKDKIKEYYEVNKNKILEYKKQYYQNKINSNNI